MPTCVLLDVSISVLRPVSPDDPDRTRIDLAQRGILHFLHFLEEYPQEFVSLLLFSSDIQILVPFTADLKLVRSALYDVNIKGSADVEGAVKSACSYCFQQWGEELQSNVILVSNSQPLSPQPDALQFSIPSSVSIHVVSMGLEGELSDNWYHQLARHNRGSFQWVNLSVEADSDSKRRGESTRLMKQAFDTIAREYYVPYRGVLACGNLSAPLQLHPDPNLSLPRGVLECQTRCSDEEHKGVMYQFPSTLIVKGFIPANQVPPSRTPYLSRHAVIALPASPDIPSIHQQLQLTAAASGGCGARPQPSVLYLLQESLTMEKVAAVVGLQHPDWFAILHTLSDSSTTVLVLSVLAPGQVLAGIGPLSWLSTEGNQAGGESAHDAEISEDKPIPSYSAKGTSVPVVSKEQIQMDMQKIGRYAHNLPQKKDALALEIEKIKRASVVFVFPNLLEAACQLLVDELMRVSNSSGNMDAALILQDMLNELRAVTAQFRAPPPAVADNAPKKSSVNYLLV
mmetsp:Transcript_21892/g.36251  ORF Transcript_21892/g.36251 Transcript_21892/m.36251 type:complete len:513 (+) Transcript_21892:57-1595(+)